MSRPGKEPEEPLLFDLPLDSPDRRPSPERKRAATSHPAEPPPEAERTRPARQAAVPATDEARFEPAAAPTPRSPRPLEAPRPREAPGRAADAEARARPGAPDALAADIAPAAGSGLVGRRLLAGLADLVVHAAVAIGVLAGSWLLGVRPALADWPALAVFLLAFSFFYVVVPLAFWSQTLGMAWARLTSVNRDGEPLTFDQTARRWLGALLTAATLGLPLLLALTGRSLSDRLSGSETLPG